VQRKGSIGRQSVGMRFKYPTYRSERPSPLSKVILERLYIFVELITANILLHLS
jgi:hypothetical protein